MDKNEFKQYIESKMDTFRGSMSWPNAQPYFLGLLFYKFLSNKISNFINKNLKNISYSEISKLHPKYKEIKKACVDNIGYWIEYENLYDEVCNSPVESINTRLKNAFDQIEDSTIIDDDNKYAFKDIFSSVDVNSQNLGTDLTKKNNKLKSLMNLFNDADLVDQWKIYDSLGDVYEIMISLFGTNTGRKAGEFFTPSNISDMLAEIVINEHKNKDINYVYDPTCGSGSLLIKIFNKLKNNNNNKIEIKKLLGQEKEPSNFNIARMNMLLHEIKPRDFQLECDDTLENNLFNDLNGKIDIIVANPPFSQEWKNENFKNDIRFIGYENKYAPNDKADWAFVQHMIYMLKDGGTIGVILPPGVLFRGNAEYSIRKKFIENQWIKGVISLPQNLFFNASTPTIILIISKVKENNDYNIFFVNAVNDFIKDGNKNSINDDIKNRIIDIYLNKKEVEGFSKKISYKEIIDNDFNLNVSRYVANNEQEEEIDINVVNKELKNIDIELSKIEKEIQSMISELVEVKLK